MMIEKAFFPQNNTSKMQKTAEDRRDLVLLPLLLVPANRGGMRLLAQDVESERSVRERDGTTTRQRRQKE